MKTGLTTSAFIVSIALVSCTSEDMLQSPSSDAPVSYIPPPENVDPAPATTSGKWIGPKGFQKDAKPKP